jgi:hypothetical protein
LTLVIEDTARNNLAAWALDAAGRGDVSAVVMSPFSTPRIGTSYKQAASQMVQRLQAGGVEVWLDPETHALQMPAVGDFRYYDGWPLWGATRGALNSDAEMRDHVERVFAAQDALDVPHLAPTILLQSPRSEASVRALTLARIAIDLDPDARLAISGDTTFWSAGTALDAHVGALAQLEAPSWSLSVARQFTVLPVAATDEEIHGLCRTARALSEDAVVHISHGDLAGLPAVAAGAQTVGTGWDPRQRVLAYASYEARTSGGDGGSWFQQSTLEGLLSLLVRGEAQALYAQDQALATRLLPGTVPPGATEAFLHHVAVLNRVVTALNAADYAAAHADLSARYTAAVGDWDAVAQALSTASRANGWLSAVANGLQAYGSTEGF